MNELVLPLLSSAKVKINLFQLLQQILTGTIGKTPLVKESEPTNALKTLALAVVFSSLSFSINVYFNYLN